MSVARFGMLRTAADGQRDPAAGSAPLAYGALGFALAFAALPVYVHVPALYVAEAGLSLASVGLTVLVVRLFDGFSDPLIGYACDRQRSRTRPIAWALPLLAVAFPLLLAPPEAGALVWLALTLLLVTLAWSVMTISYNAWAAEVSPVAGTRTRWVAAREAFSVVGIMVAAALPGLLADDERQGLMRLAWVFVPALLICGLVTLRRAPLPPTRGALADGGMPSMRATILSVPSDPRLRRLLLLFAANGIAAAIPATVVLFFIADVLQTEASSGVFLLAYFGAGATGMWGWVRLADRLGNLRTWLAAMLLAVASFGWAATLGAGDTAAFVMICLVSGLAFGADLALPPAVLGDLLQRRGAGQVSGRAAAAFGWWNLVNKLNLALAAGVALPLLDGLGYAPGARDDDALAALVMVYAGLPVVLKLIAAALLWRWRHELGEGVRRG